MLRRTIGGTRPFPGVQDQNDTALLLVWVVQGIGGLKTVRLAIDSARKSFRVRQSP